MSFLSHQRFVDEGARTYGEEVSFFGSTLEDTDTELRQWLLRTMPLGPCKIFLQTTSSIEGTQHRLLLFYTCQLQVEDRVEPKGLLRSTEVS